MMDVSLPVTNGTEVQYTHQGELNCTNTTCLIGIEDSTLIQLPWPVFLLLVIAALAVSGNSLVCVAIWQEPRLQNMFNFLVASLAVGDILNSLLVMPLAVAKAYLGYFPGPAGLAETWYFVSLLLTTASITHMAAIAVDRCIGLKKPLFYCKYTTVWFIKMKTLLTWLGAVVASLPAFLLHPWDQSLPYMGYQTCGTPCRASVLAYGVLAFLLPLVVAAVGLGMSLHAIYLGHCLVKSEVHICPSPTDESFGTTIRETSSNIPHSRSPSFQMAGFNTSFKGNRTTSFTNFNASFRGSKKRKGSRREALAGSSPKLDRHPSLRYSVRRKPPLGEARGELGGSMRRDSLLPPQGGGGDSGMVIGLAIRRASIQELPLKHADPTMPFTCSPRGSVKTGSFRLRGQGKASSQPKRGGSLRNDPTAFHQPIPEIQALRGPKEKPDTTNNIRADSRHTPLDRSEAENGGQDTLPGSTAPLLGDPMEPDPTDNMSMIPTCSLNSVSAMCNSQPLSQEPLSKKTSPGVLCRTKGNLKRHVNKEKQAVKVLLVMAVCYLVLFLPYFIVWMVDGLCEQCDDIFPPHVVFAFEWLAFCASAINPVIYHALNKDFRQAFLRILRLS